MDVSTGVPWTQLREAEAGTCRLIQVVHVGERVDRTVLKCAKA